ncbi:MAG: hypothetical protein FJW36_16145 [Acidobacteria bacterium]|nr:hypothetical protein [Acidobacteriota bacterium]
MLLVFCFWRLRGRAVFCVHLVDEVRDDFLGEFDRWGWLRLGGLRWFGEFVDGDVALCGRDDTIALALRTGWQGLGVGDGFDFDVFAVADEGFALSDLRAEELGW